MISDLFALIRKAAPPAIWSLGIELSRKAAIVFEKSTDEEILVRVTTPGKSLSSTVKIWPAEEDWHCDCGRSTGVCEHVAAAVLTLRRAEEQGTPLAKPESAARIRYDFVREKSALTLTRVWENAGQAEPIVGSLYPLKITPSQADASIDPLVADLKAKPLPADLVRAVLTHLRGNVNVTLNGSSISVGRPAAAWRIFAEDGDNHTVRVFAEAAAGVSEVFSNGAVIIEDVLSPSEDGDLTPLEKEIIEKGKTFPVPRFTELASKILPALEKRFSVTNRSTWIKNPEDDDVPRVVVNSTAAREILSILPLLVYGEPPYARVDGNVLTLVGDSGRVPQRQLEAEGRAVASFRSKTGLTVGRRADFRGDAAVLMADKLSSLRLGTGGDVFKLFSGTTPALQPRLEVSGDTFRFVFETRKEGPVADSREVLRAWRDGRDRVGLLDGGWAEIPTDWLTKHGHTILDLLDAREQGSKLTPYAKVDLARLCESLESPCPADFSTLRKNLDGFTSMPDASLPKDLTATLRTYQKRGVDWLSFLKKNQLGALLADDMGLGKTVQAICVLSKPSLIVAPTSVLANWEKEIKRFRPRLKVQVHHGADRQLDPAADVVLTSYAILRLDAAALSKVDWDTVVLDEAQNIKNPQSLSAQAAYGLKAKFRAALSGTPVENRIEDLWSLFHFINPGLLGTLSIFKERGTSSLSTKTKPFILRRLKKEVVPELPPRTELVLDVELSRQEKDLYDAVHAATRGEVLEALGKKGNVMAALECLLRLRQAACHPGLLPGQSAPDSSKLQLLREKLEEIVAEGHKALVFSQWTGLLDLLSPTLTSESLSFLRLDGSTRAEERTRIVEAFQSETGPPLLLMTLKAGGVGLNLTAADHVFLIDPWWNPAAEDQAADRAHRIGQDKPVFIHRLVSRGTVEEKILALQQSKRATAAAALSGSGGLSITREDLLALLD